MGIFLRVIVFLFLIVVAVFAGFWVAELTAPELDIPLAEVISVQKVEMPVETKPEIIEEIVVIPPPPVFFFLNALENTNLDAVNEEIRMASEIGLHQYFVTIPLPWTAEDKALGEIQSSLDLVLGADPEANIFLHVKLDPSQEWLEANPDEAVHTGDSILPLVSVASQLWLAQVKKGFDILIELSGKSYASERITGYSLAALENGQWCRNGPYDTSPANLLEYRKWLETRYTDDALLQKAWNNASATFATAQIPATPANEDTKQVFFELTAKDDKTPSMHNQVDFLKFTSETTANAISDLADYIKRSSQAETQVLVAYGYSFELLSNSSGHLALNTLLESDIDGFISPVSYLDRGIGGTGGFMGPVDSAALHSKKWYLIDDTRTGLKNGSAEASSIDSSGLESVSNVHLRNFSAAATHKMGLCWGDPQGDGMLFNQAIWDGLGNIYDAYKSLNASFANDTAKNNDISELAPLETVNLTVVVDETSRFYQQCDLPLNKYLLSQVRDCALQAGVPVNYCLLQDIIAGRAPKGSVYIFANCFLLNKEERDALHSVLIQHGATAIWMYAPGYISDSTDDELETVSASVENISATTGMVVKSFEKAAKTGSIWTLKHEDQPGLSGLEFGEVLEWKPLFYIEDTSADVCATFRDSKKPCIALKYFDEGWSSIFYAEPFISTMVLKELLFIAEQHRFLLENVRESTETVHIAQGLFSIHAKTPGERIIDLGKEYDVEDFFNKLVGWPKKRALNLKLKAGETRILKISKRD